jgi:hypothetical protein
VLRGDRALAQAAVEAVRQWRYKPYYLDYRQIQSELAASRQVSAVGSWTLQECAHKSPETSGSLANRSGMVQRRKTDGWRRIASSTARPGAVAVDVPDGL